MKKAVLSLVIIMSVFSIKSFTQGWTTVNSTGTSFILYGMSFPPDQSTIGYACGMQYTYNAPGVIVKTTDGGNNWTQIWPASGTIDGLQGIWFINDLVGFAVGWNNYSIKTTDGGTTWTPVTIASGVWYFRDVEFWDASNGIAVAVMNSPSDQAAFITSDGGNTWTPASSGMGTASIMGISYASASKVFAVGTDASVYKSTDGGHNWSVSSTLSAMLLGVDFGNDSFGVVGGEEKMFATSDGGTNWSTYTTGYENFYGALAIPGGTGYIGGTDERIHKTTNYGQTWALDNSGGTSSLYRIRKTSNGTLFACGSQGRILKLEAPLDADFTASPTTVCTGDTVYFEDNSTGAIDSWAWVFEGGTPGSSTLQNPVVVYNTSGTFDAQLTVTAGSDNSVEMKSDYITVYGALVAPVTPTGPSEVCGTYSHQYTTQSVQYAESYDWMVTPANAGTMSGNDTVATFTASNTWSGSFAIKVRAENQCGDGPWSPEFTGMLYHDPVIYFLMGDGAFCEGEDGAEIILDGSEEGVSYELFKDNVTTGVIMAGTGDTLSFGLFDETGLYTAAGYTANCSENMIGQVYVHMEPAPGQPSTPEGPESTCNDETSEYATAGGSNADDYTWGLSPEEAGTVIPNGDECSVEWSASYTGMAYLSVAGINDCGSGVSSDSLEITVNSSPVPAVVGPGTVCDNTEENYYSAENSGSTYEWEVTGGTITSGEGTYQVTVLWGEPGPGMVVVTETNEAGCEASSQEFNVTIDDCIGIGENNIEGLHIYPNPASDNLNIEGLKDARVKVYNILGEELFMADKVIGTHSIDISSFEKGIYLLKVEQDGKIAGYRIVKR